MTAERIRDLNDAFRRSLAGSRVVMTSGVYTLSHETQVAAVRAVAAFSEFTIENDPHGEHDFGSFEIDGRKLFWKIDYYDAAMEFGSEDPADPAKTTRVLTVMLASEY